MIQASKNHIQASELCSTRINAQSLNLIATSSGMQGMNNGPAAVCKTTLESPLRFNKKFVRMDTRCIL